MDAEIDEAFVVAGEDSAIVVNCSMLMGRRPFDRLKIDKYISM